MDSVGPSSSCFAHTVPTRSDRVSVCHVWHRSLIYFILHWLTFYFVFCRQDKIINMHWSTGSVELIMLQTLNPGDIVVNVKRFESGQHAFIEWKPNWDWQNINVVNKSNCSHSVKHMNSSEKHRGIMTKKITRDQHDPKSWQKLLDQSEKFYRWGLRLLNWWGSDLTLHETS